MNTVRTSKKTPPMAATQTYLRFGEIRDETIVLKNGGLRSVLAVDAVNMYLKNEDERNALVSGYQQFLNSLEFPVQMIARSKKMDIGPYLRTLKGLEIKQKNDLMKKQVARYTSYIEELVTVADIMKKEFYVVVPLDPFRAKNKTAIEKLWQFIHPGDSTTAFNRRKA